MSQNMQILKHLKSGKGITPKLALNLFGSMRLAARIYDLISKGYPIKKIMITKGRTTYALYFMSPEWLNENERLAA